MSTDGRVINIEEEEKSKEGKYDDHYKLHGRRFWCGLGALKWYFCEFRCDNSHLSFTMYLFMLLAAWGIYVAAFTAGHFFYSMLAGCLLGVLMSLYAIPKLKDIMEMRKALRQLVKANIGLSETHSNFQGDISSVNKAHEKLDQIQTSINNTNVKLKDSYNDFSQYGQKLNERNVKNIQQLKKLKYYFEQCQTNYQALLTRAEKTTLNALYRQIHKKDGKPGLSRLEFDDFIKKLPRHYQARFAPYDDTFCKYAGSDANMDYKEFQIMIANMARAEALGL